MKSEEYKALDRVVRKFEPRSRLLRTWPLEGGISAQVTAFEVERPGGQTKKMIVRRHGDVDLQQNPNVARDEFRLLEITQSVGLATPTPYYLDQSGEIFPTPYLVVEYIEGETEFAPTDLNGFISKLTTYLSKIHKIDDSNLDLSFLPEQEKIYTEKLARRPEKLDESLEEGRIREAMKPHWPRPQRNKSVLLQGDFWPGNVLWRDGKIVGIIDWEDAAFGDPLGDLSISRLEILWAFGIDAMHQFTNDYRSMTTIDFTHLPYWDLCAALRPVFRLAEWAGGDNITEKKMQNGHRVFVAQAFEKLSIR